MSPQIPTPVAITSIAAPQDQHLLTQWETHLLPLQQSRRITPWSHTRILPGMNRREELTRHVDQADIIVFLLSADFFAHAECYQLMELVLAQPQRVRPCIIPLLLRPVSWRATPLGELACLPANGRPVTRWGDRDEAFEDCVDSLVQMLTTMAPPRRSAPTTPTDQRTPGRHSSCFISYADADEALAQRLYADLKARGVECWFAPHDMKIGARIRPTIEQAIHQQEKLLLLLSEHSIGSSWVKDEVEAALERERVEGCEMLFPLRLDESVLRPTAPAWAAHLRRQINIGDFTNWADPRVYQRALERLMRDLEQTDEAGERGHQR